MSAAPTLEVRHGEAVREYHLDEPVISIGRAFDNQIVLEDPDVSRYHARLLLDDGLVQIADWGSSNGTRVNDCDIPPKEPQKLADGDVIAIGAFRMTLHSPDASLARTVAMRPETVELPPEPARAPEPPPSARAQAPSYAPRPSYAPPPSPQPRPTPAPPPMPVSFEATVAMVPREMPRLLVTMETGTEEHLLTGDRITIGREAGNDVVIDDHVVSRHHAELRRTGKDYEIVDLNSANGLIFHDQLIPHLPLSDGDVIWIGTKVSLTYHRGGRTEDTSAPQALSLAGKAAVTIGRIGCDVNLDHPTVSRRHAQISKQDGRYVIADFGSTNGTFVNGERVVPAQPRVLLPGDTVRIGPAKFVLAADSLQHQDESLDLQLDAIHLNHFVGKGTQLLHDLSLSIHPREFVAIVGGSGTGKSTLLDALNGFRPSKQGQVLVNGTDLYHHFAAYRTSLGYVPQEDIIHRELTVYEALDFSAQLRLPADTTSAERHERVEQVLLTLGLAERRNVQIGRLSGGQRKRVSIGAELLTQPGLFFLDEATSGLDPGTESQMMRLLRKLADQGHTILLITHATKNVMVCDHVLFLARGGWLAYFGPPEEALEYFGVTDFDQIYEKLESELTPEAWAERYQASTQFRKYVVERLSESSRLAAAPAAGEAAAQSQHTIAAPKPASALKQLVVLSHRNLTILTRDKASLILMLTVAPLFASLDFIVGDKGLFNAKGGSPDRGISDLFMMTIICILIGSAAAMREIVKEADVYKRERMVSLQLGPYLLSKLWIGVGLAAYQAAAFMFVKMAATGWPTDGAIGTAYMTLFLTVASGMVLGLLISAASPNANVAPLLLILSLVPQFMFGGGMVPLKELGPAGTVIGSFISSKWGFESLVTTSGLGKGPAHDACWKLPEDKRKALTDEEKKSCTCMGPNVFTQCAFPGVADLAPKDNEPISQLRAVGEAEGTIGKFYDSYSTMFDVNLQTHWLKQTALLLGMFGLLVVVQKRKDRI